MLCPYLSRFHSVVQNSAVDGSLRPMLRRSRFRVVYLVLSLGNGSSVRHPIRLSAVDVTTIVLQSVNVLV